MRDRIAGYIDLNNLLRVSGRFDNIYDFITYIRRHRINIKVVPNSVTNTKFMITFNLLNTGYFFKYDEEESPYAELIAEEIAKSMGLPCVDYDIATIGGFVGALSKDFKKMSEILIVTGEQVIEYVHNNKDICEVFGATNNLETIWMGLIEIFKNNPEGDIIVNNLMKKIIDMYIFDIITKQNDRHSLNWEIVKYRDNHYDLRPLFDNARIMFSDEEKPSMLLKATHRSVNLEENIKRFIEISSSEFRKQLENNLWAISEENIQNVLNRVEEKIGYELPKIVKDKYKNGFKKHYEFLITCLEKDKIKTKGV